jgi:hypothetical protein
MHLAYEAGGAADPPGKPGLAALRQRVMTMTSKHARADMYHGGWIVSAQRTAVGDWRRTGRCSEPRCR